MTYPIAWSVKEPQEPFHYCYPGGE